MNKDWNTKERMVFNEWWQRMDKEFEAYTPELLVTVIELASNILHKKIVELRNATKKAI